MNTSSPQSGRSLGVALLAIVLALCLVEAACAASAAPARSRTSQDIRHPIGVRITPLDPVARGSTLRLRVEVTAARTLERAEVRLTSAGGTTTSGARRVSLGALRRDETRAAEFALAVPAEGRRFLVQFQIRGAGGDGLLSRGATYNILPEGPADSGRLVQSSTGPAIEFRARRLP
ncbi:MAG: hypothetical protein HZC42_09410 [Candidatus Eisenbacteria bacterium]|nr:hypothetical protein [Candidatus Eisenbacteria bacterium]